MKKTKYIEYRVDGLWVIDVPIKKSKYGMVPPPPICVYKDNCSFGGGGGD